MMKIWKVKKKTKKSKLLYGITGIFLVIGTLSKRHDILLISFM